jgi:hypothetical protein
MLGQIAAPHVQMFQKISFPRHHMRQDPDLDDSCENRQHLTASIHYQIDNSSVIHPFSVNDPATPYPDMCVSYSGMWVRGRCSINIPHPLPSKFDQRHSLNKDQAALILHGTLIRTT